MSRLIKRYGSRKLYDTQESRYVSLEDIASWVRDGEDILVQDNGTGENVTVQTLTQVISEEGRKGASFLPSNLLHDLIRLGNNAVTVWVTDIHGLTVSVGTYIYPCNVPICYSVDILSLYSTCPHVQSSVKVIASQLSEST